MNEKKKVLLIVNTDLAVAGTNGVRPFPIAQALEKEYDVTVLCRDYNKQEQYGSMNIIRPIPFGALLPKILTGISTFIWRRFPSRSLQVKLFEFFSLRFIRKQNFAFAHSFEFSPQLYKELKKKEVTILQDVNVCLNTMIVELNKKLPGFFPKWQEKVPDFMADSLPLVDHFIASSPICKQSLLLYGISEDKISVCPYGVDSSKFKPQEKEGSTFRVAYAGNINTNKGILFLLDAWKQLELKNAELVLFGRVYPELKEPIAALKDKGVHAPGYVNLAEHLPAADIFVFPSVMEGSGKTVYEALACGLPVVTTPNAGSIVTDQEEGFLVPIMDSQALGEKIKLLYEDKELRERMGKKARVLAEQYSWKYYGERTLAIYKQQENGS